MRNTLRLLGRYYRWQARVTVRAMIALRLIPAGVGRHVLSRLAAPADVPRWE
jgi:hypothetical protein